MEILLVLFFENDVLLKRKELVVGGEDVEMFVWVLGLERVYNGIVGYVREVECVEEGIVFCSLGREGMI